MEAIERVMKDPGEAASATLLLRVAAQERPSRILSKRRAAATKPPVARNGSIAPCGA